MRLSLQVVLTLFVGSCHPGKRPLQGLAQGRFGLLLLLGSIAQMEPTTAEALEQPAEALGYAPRRPANVDATS